MFFYILHKHKNLLSINRYTAFTDRLLLHFAGAGKRQADPTVVTDWTIPVVETTDQVGIEGKLALGFGVERNWPHVGMNRMNFAKVKRSYQNWTSYVHN